MEGKDGKSASLADSIHAFSCLWNLKYGHTEEAQKYSQYLQMLRDWRNDSSHTTPTTSEQEIDAVIQVVVAMYLYVTGNSITDLEMAGHDMGDEAKTPRKLENVEDDHDVRNFIFNRLHMNAETDNMELQREVIDMYGSRYPDMSLNDWRHIIEDFTTMVREATQTKAKVISMQPEQLDVAAEPKDVGKDVGKQKLP